jgi:hypothetical protein
MLLSPLNYQPESPPDVVKPKKLLAAVVVALVLVAAVGGGSIKFMIESIGVTSGLTEGSDSAVATFAGTCVIADTALETEVATPLVVPLTEL